MKNTAVLHTAEMNSLEIKQFHLEWSLQILVLRKLGSLFQHKLSVSAEVGAV